MAKNYLLISDEKYWEQLQSLKSLKHVCQFYQCKISMDLEKFWIGFIFVQESSIFLSKMYFTMYYVSDVCMNYFVCKYDAG